MRVQIIQAPTFELQPEKKYLICINQSAISTPIAQDLRQAIMKIGVMNVVILIVEGDPSTAVKVIEQGEK